MHEEWVIQANPDRLMKLSIFFTEEQRRNSEKITEAVKDEVLNRPGWDSMKAVKNGVVFVLDEGLCGGPRGMVGAYAAASRLHGDLVGDGEALRIKREYVETFHNLPFVP